MVGQHSKRYDEGGWQISKATVPASRPDHLGHLGVENREEAANEYAARPSPKLSATDCVNY